MKVCDGCWTWGVCVKQTPYTRVGGVPHQPKCKCPCDGGRNWVHTDDPNQAGYR